MKSWYCVAFCIIRIGGAWYILGATDIRDPDKVKPLGGYGKYPERFDQTLVREFLGNTNKKLTPIKFREVYREDGENNKVFFLVTEISGKIVPGEEIIVKRTNEETLKICLWAPKEFLAKLFMNYQKAFIKAVDDMSRVDKTFRI